MSSTPISKDILEALTKYTASLKNKVSLVLQTGEHSKRAELASFLNQICGVSENLLFLERDFKKGARSPLTFFLESNEVMSICSTGFFRRSFLLLWPRFFLSDIKQQETVY